MVEISASPLTEPQMVSHRSCVFFCCLSSGHEPFRECKTLWRISLHCQPAFPPPLLLDGSAHLYFLVPPMPCHEMWSLSICSGAEELELLLPCLSCRLMWCKMHLCCVWLSGENHQERHKSSGGFLLGKSRRCRRSTQGRVGHVAAPNDTCCNVSGSCGFEHRVQCSGPYLAVCK